MKTFSEATKNFKPKGKSVVVAVGRFNPPTTGHEKLLKKVKEVQTAKGADDHIVYYSYSNDPKKNPLTAAQKAKYLKQFFPGYKFKQMPKPSAKGSGVYACMQDLSDRGYTQVYVVTGEDHLAEYQLVKKYIKKTPTQKDGYNFSKYEIVNAGERDPDSEGVSGMSASKMRKAAFDKDVKAFMTGIPSNVSKTVAMQMYKDVRKGMALKEDFLPEAPEMPVTIIALTSSMGESEKSTIGKMEEVCKKRKINFHPVRIKTATIDIAKASPDKITIENFDGEGNDVTIVPSNTLCIVRGGTMNSEVGIALLMLLQNNGVFMVNERGGMDLCANKLQTAIALKRHEIPHPRTAFVADAESIPDALKQIGGKFPVIVKTLTGAEGIGVSIIESEKSLVSVLQSLWKYGAEVIMQEFIPGFTHDVRSICLNGKIFASAKRDKAKGDFRTNIARGSKGGSFKLSEEEIKLVENVARISRCYYVGVDHVVAGGKPYIIEMNASPGSGNVYTLYEDGKPVRDVDGDGLVEELIKHLSNKQNWKLFSSVAVVEEIKVNGEDFLAKVDTGNSGYNSVHATDIKINEKNHTVTFKFNGEKEMTKPIQSRIRLRHGSSKEEAVRPTVLFDVVFNNREFKNVKFSLADRSHMNYKVLLGLRFLVQAGVIVDPKDMSAAKARIQEDLDEAKLAMQGKEMKSHLDGLMDKIKAKHGSTDVTYSQAMKVVGATAAARLAARGKIKRDSGKTKKGELGKESVEVEESKYKTKTGKAVSPAQDEKSDLPKKYVSGLSKTQAAKRKAQFAKRSDYSDSDPRAWKKLPGDPKETERKSKYTQLFAKKFGKKVDEAIDALMGIDSMNIPLSSKVEKVREYQTKVNTKEEKEICAVYIDAMKNEMYEPYSNINTTLDEDFEWMLVNSTDPESEARRVRKIVQEVLEIGTHEIVKAYSKMTPGQKYYSEDDEKEEQDALYKEWEKLVNMGPKELEDFIDSDEGEEAGLSRKEASKAGAKGGKIKSGRDSARAIVRMLNTKKSDWTPNDWAWAKRQVNFITRMSGAKGPMRDEKGRPTRKLLALKIWGHNPEK